MDARQSPDDGMVADRDVAGQTGRIGKNEMAAEMTIKQVLQDLMSEKSC